MAVTNKYGGVQVIQEATPDSPHEGHWKFQGEDFFNVGELHKKIEAIAKIERTKNPLTLKVEAALQEASDPLKPSALRTMAAKYAGSSVEKVAYNFNQKFVTLAKEGKGVNHSEVTRLGAAYKILTGEVASGYTLAETNISKSKTRASSETKGNASARQSNTSSTERAISGGGETLRPQGPSQGGEPSAATALTRLREAKKARVAWGEMDATGVEFRDLPTHIQNEWTDAVSMGESNGLLQEKLADVGKDAVNRHKLHDVANEVITYIFPKANGRSEAQLKQYHEFIRSYLASPREHSHKEIAATYGVSLRTAKSWAASLPTFLEDHSAALKGAIDHVANIHGMPREKLLQLIANSTANAKIEENGHALLSENGHNTNNSANVEDGSDHEGNQVSNGDRNAKLNLEDGERQGLDVATHANEIDVNDLAHEDSGINSLARKSLSLQERYNPTETINARAKVLLETLEKINTDQQNIHDNYEMDGAEKQDKFVVVK